MALVWWLRRWRRGQGEVRPRAFSIHDNVGSFYGIRYPHPGGPAVLLIHGYGGNSRNWMDIGHRLHQAGYDVWMANLRGHGNGHQRSTSRQGEYGFRHFVVEDLPVLVEHVARQTARRIHLVGHSLGGVASLAYLGGVREGPEGGLMVDEGLARHLATARIETLTCIGSPPHFRNFPKSLGWLVARPASLLETLQKALLWQGPAPKATRGIRGQILGRLDRSLQKMNPVRGIVEVANFDRQVGEFKRLLDRGLSPAPKDLTRDVNRWVRGGEIVSEEGFWYVEPRLLGVPLLLVSGELDQLGPPDAIHTQAQVLQDFANVWEVWIEGTSHVDLINGKRAADLTGEVLLQFFRSPASLGERGSQKRLTAPPRL